jgi:hypothetical protein
LLVRWVASSVFGLPGSSGQDSFIAAALDVRSKMTSSTSYFSTAITGDEQIIVTRNRSKIRVAVIKVIPISM